MSPALLPSRAIHWIRKRGIILSVDGGDIVLRDPQKQRNAAMLDYLRVNKAAIITELLAEVMPSRSAGECAPPVSEKVTPDNQVIVGADSWELLNNVLEVFGGEVVAHPPTFNDPDLIEAGKQADVELALGPCLKKGI